MVFKNKVFNKFWRFSCSFQLGIPIMAVIAILIATGTVFESYYNDSQIAKKLIFDSWMMWLAMCLLVYNLTVVVIDRMPWKKAHYPFITVHAGIIIIIFGGFITSQFGLDGQVSVPVNGTNSYVSVNNTDLVVYATFDGDRYTKIFDKEVQFFQTPPDSKSPYVLNLGDDQIQVIDFVRYGILQNKVKESNEDPQAGASIRFQLKNDKVTQIQQITQTKKGKEVVFNLGPAKVILGAPPKDLQPANQIYVTPFDGDTVDYYIYHKDQSKPFKSGKMKLGDTVDTGWMGLQFRLLDYIPQAIEIYDVVRLKASTPMTMSAIQIQYKDLKRWVALNDVVKLFGSKSAFLLSYQNRRIDLGFQIHLKQFDINRYQGTRKAMNYASDVVLLKKDDNLSAIGNSKVLDSANSSDDVVSGRISMNEPMKHSGYTIYQASFQEDEMTGKPVASVFSVNKDPGRAIKYLGSIILSLGLVWLFYQRRKKATSQ